MQKVSFLVSEEVATALPRLAAGIDSFLQANDCPAKVAFSVQFAIEEVVTNVLTHGAKGDGAQKPEVKIDLLRDGDAIQIEISDDGVLFNPLTDAPKPNVNATLDERKPGGLGLHLLRATMDSAQYSAENGRNCLTLRKRLTEAPSAKT